MCHPAITIVLAVAAEAHRQHQEAEEREFQQELFERNQEIINRQTQQRVEGIQREQRIGRQQSARQASEILLEGRQARATARAGAAETGTAGASVEAINQEFFRQEAEALGAVERNQEFRDLAARDQVRSARTQQEVAILDAFPALTGPDFLGAALRIGSSVSSSGIGQGGTSSPRRRPNTARPGVDTTRIGSANFSNPFRN